MALVKPVMINSKEELREHVKNHTKLLCIVNNEPLIKAVKQKVNEDKVNKNLTEIIKKGGATYVTSALLYAVFPILGIASFIIGGLGTIQQTLKTFSVVLQEYTWIESSDKKALFLVKTYGENKFNDDVHEIDFSIVGDK